MAYPPSQNRPGSSRRRSTVRLPVVARRHPSFASQRLCLGGVAGLGAALCGAIFWALVTVVSHYQIGWMAVGVGWLVGVTVRFVGQGTTPRFGLVGAGLALFGCFSANIVAIGIVAARQEGPILPALFLHFDAALLVTLLSTTFQPIDLFFYGLAAYAGYTFSFQRPPASPGSAG